MIPVGLAITALGIFTFWLPLPIGLPLMVLGVLILVHYSLFARRAAAGIARRYPAFRKFMRKLRQLQRGLGKRFGGAEKRARSAASAGTE